MPDQTQSLVRTIKIVHWEEDGVWLGYLQDYPDYWTQGGSLDDLRDLYADITSGALPGLRKVAELAVA